MKQYLTVVETAEYLNTSERFVRRLVAEPVSYTHLTLPTICSV